MPRIRPRPPLTFRKMMELLERRRQEIAREEREREEADAKAKAAARAER
jgi:hypothetical protein